MFKNEALKKVYDRIQEIPEDNSGFRGLTIIDLNAMGMSTRRIMKVSQIEAIQSYDGEAMKITFKLPRKRKLFSYTISQKEISNTLFFVGHRLDIKLDKDFNTFMGNAKINLAVDTIGEVDKIVEENLNHDFNKSYVRLVGKNNTLDIEYSDRHCSEEIFKSKTEG